MDGIQAEALLDAQETKASSEAKLDRDAAYVDLEARFINRVIYEQARLYVFPQFGRFRYVRIAFNSPETSALHTAELDRRQALQILIDEQN